MSSIASSRERLSCLVHCQISRACQRVGVSLWPSWPAGPAVEDRVPPGVALDGLEEGVGFCVCVCVYPKFQEMRPEDGITLRLGVKQPSLYC